MAPSYKLPSAYLERMQHLLGAEYPGFLDIYTQPAAVGLRVNILKISLQDFSTISPFSLSPITWCPSGFTIPPDQQPGKHPYHAAGLYYLQDPSAMAVAELLAPQPGERVLDLAAAPGGKTTHLAALMQNQGLLIANEIHPRRAWDLAENLERCGIRNVVILNETPERIANHFGAYFDRVLVDAPCSGEGLFRKNQAARKDWSPQFVKSCAIRQMYILGEAARLVQPGGRLVYTTCTFSPEENEAVITNFLQNNPDFYLAALPEIAGVDSTVQYQPGRSDWVNLPPSTLPPLHFTLRLWPQYGMPEGHFIAVMHRQGGRNQSSLRSARYHNFPKPAYQSLVNFWQASMNSSIPESHLLLCGSYIYQTPPESPDLSGLRIIHPGYWLGKLKSGLFEPAHSLAMATLPQEARQMLNLDSQSLEMIDFLQGKILQSPGDNGWVLITVDGYSLGWGKRIRGILKNYYPRGLRWL